MCLGGFVPFLNSNNKTDIKGGVVGNKLRHVLISISSVLLTCEKGICHLNCGFFILKALQPAKD